MSDLRDLFDPSRELASRPRPSIAVLDGSAWDRRRYIADIEYRVRLRRLILEREPRVENVSEQVERLREEEFAEYDRYMQRCVTCGGDGARLSMRWLKLVCDTCLAAIMDAPSTPPARGITSALARAKRAGLVATLTDVEWRATVDYFDDRCAYCWGPWSLVEHATPIEQGGGTVAWNCVPACRSCNVRKGERTIEDYREFGVCEQIIAEALDWLRQCGRPA